MRHKNRKSFVDSSCVFPRPRVSQREYQNHVLQVKALLVALVKSIVTFFFRFEYHYQEAVRREGVFLSDVF